MPSRILRAGMWSSRAVNSLHDKTFRLFCALLNAADDYGLVEVSYSDIRCHAPLMSWTEEEVAKMMGELADARLVLPYQAADKSLAAIAKWQANIRAKKPRHPAPSWGLTHCLEPLGFKDKETREAASLLLKHLAPTGDTLGTPQGIPRDNPGHEGLGLGVRVRGKEAPKEQGHPGEPLVRVEVGAPQGTPDGIKRGTRLPKDWVLPDEWQDWAITYCREQGLHVQPSMVIEWSLRFADYWHEVPGIKGVKLSWSGTWRNAVKDWYAPKAPRIPPARTALRGI